MYETPEFCARLGCTVEIVEIWVAEGWILPDEQEGRTRFTDTDLARAQLIGDLQRMGVNHEAMVVVLGLIDQLHGLRSSLQQVLAALQAQPEPVRRQIAEQARRLSGR